MGLRAAAALGLALALVFPGARPGAAASSGLAVEIEPGQLVTVSGQSGSLATLIAEICQQAGVRLRGYEAGDRPITVAYERAPLREVLQRMLRDETYMIGVRTSTGSPDIEVAWVHVTGSKGGASGSPVALPSPVAAPPTAPPPPVPGSMADFGIPASVVTNALGSQDEAVRRDATRTLAQHVEANPGVLDSFFAKDFGTTADELAKFPYAKEALQTLAIRQKDPVARAKLDAIVKSIGLKRGDQPKKPTYNELMQQGIPH